MVDIYIVKDVQVLRQGVPSGGDGPIVGDEDGVIEIAQLRIESDFRHGGAGHARARNFSTRLSLVQKEFWEGDKALSEMHLDEASNN